MSVPSPEQSAAALNRLNRLSEARSVAGRELTEAEVAALDEMDQDPTCHHCGGIHARACPRVRRMEFHPNGVVAAVEFWSHRETDWTGVVFEDQAGHEDFLATIEDAFLLVQWMGSRKGQPDYILQAKRRITAVYDAEVQSHGGQTRLSDQISASAAPPP